MSVAGIIREFGTEHPAVRVEVRHAGGSGELAEQVRTGALDLAFVAPPGEGPDGVALTTLSREPMSLVCHCSHPMALEPQIRLGDLADVVFADVPPTWGTRILLEKALADAHIRHEVRYEINDMASVVDFVEQDLAVAVMPPSFFPPHPDVRLIPVSDAPSFVVSLATPSDRSASAASVALERFIFSAAGAG